MKKNASIVIDSQNHIETCSLHYLMRSLSTQFTLSLKSDFNSDHDGNEDCNPLVAAVEPVRCVVGCCSDHNDLVEAVEEEEAKICDENHVDRVLVDSLLHDGDILHVDTVGSDQVLRSDDIVDCQCCEDNVVRGEGAYNEYYCLPRQQLAVSVPRSFSSALDVGSQESMEMVAQLRRGHRKRPATQLGRGPRKTVREGWAC